MKNKIIADTNTFLEVALHQPQTLWIIEKTQNSINYAPQVLPFEIANALSAMVKRKQITEQTALIAYNKAMMIPVNLREINIYQALQIATANGIYAYDAFYLQLASETGYPILTLDKGMKYVAEKLGITIL